MGNQISSSIHYFLKPEEGPTVLFFGLDGAGKTTILYRLKFKDDEDRPTTNIPTVGFNVETVTTLRGYIYGVGCRRRDTFLMPEHIVKPLQDDGVLVRDSILSSLVCAKL